MGQKTTALPTLPRSDSTQAHEAIERVMAERSYPTSPAAAARAGWEAAWRTLEQQRVLTALVEQVNSAGSQA